MKIGYIKRERIDIMKILVVLLIISNIIQWRCITGIIYDILKLERNMRYEKFYEL